MHRLFSVLSVSAANVLLTISLLTAAPLKFEQHAGYRVAHLDIPKGGHTGFTLLSPAETGILFTNQPSEERASVYQAVIEGAGVCAGDFDGDGLPDLYFCNVEGANALFRNLGGFKFENVTAAAGVACTNQISRGAAFADVNGDGWLDLVVTSVTGPNACLLNDGKGHFNDFTREAGLVLMDGGSTSLALADVNGDGSLDLYVANTGVVNTKERSVSVVVRNGRPEVVGRGRQRYRIIGGQLRSKAHADSFYLNDGRGHFKAVDWTDGTFLNTQGKPLTEAPAELALGVMFRDLNGDGAPDIYVCNDWEGPDRIWLNDGKGHFRALPDLDLRKTSLFSMSVDFADLNRDGYDDFYNADMISRFARLRLTQMGGTNPPPEFLGEVVDRQQVRRNTLQISRGDGSYAELANYAGVQATDWTWCVAFLDADLDGFEDILVANGHLYDLQDRDTRDKEMSAMSSDVRGGLSAKLYPPLQTPNYLFRNRGDCTFEEKGAAWGFNSSNACHGISFVDLDNDGDLDVVVTCLKAPPLIYRNETSAPRVAVRLKGKAPNTSGIGAKLVLHGGAVPYQSQEIQCGGRYLSSDQAMRVFAAGTLTNKMSLEVTWRSGLHSLIQGVEANCLYEVEETGATVRTASEHASKGILFEDASASLGHRHNDPPFDDFSVQMMLPRRLSQLGPGIAWFDLDGDGRDDLIIGGGRGSSLGVYLNQGEGKWKPLQGEFTNSLPDDSAGIVGAVLQPGGRSLLAGLAAYESPQTNLPSVLRFDLAGPSKTATIGKTIPRGDSSTGPLALADVDGDGSLDIFVGGRLRAGRFPEPASSQLYLNKGGALEADQEAAAALNKVGLVTSAVFSDLDVDGFPELLLACEWGPVRIFKNQHGHLKEQEIVVTPPAEGRGNSILPADATKLSSLTGLWTAVATGDFDEDGRMDIVLGNWGLNSAYQIGAPGPWFIYYGDFNEDGLVHVFDAFQESSSKAIMPWHDLGYMEKDLPWLRARFPTHKAYAEATMPAILQGRIFERVTAQFLGSVLLLNRGDHFELRLLPQEAQWAPVMGIAIADFDGDGHEDLFLSQNYFAGRPEEERLDAGRGLLLLGDGKGGFRSVPGQESGIRVYGEQRACAVSDYDSDGRADLVVTENRGQTHLFHNRGGKPGVRVRLAGPKQNPEGIGAVIRAKYKDRLGPAREIQTGSGFWSQNSAVQVMGISERPVEIEVRWPGGKLTRTAVAENMAEIRISPDGTPPAAVQ